MINAAIVGLGGWGRTLVGSVQHQSDKIRFTKAVSRDPSKLDTYLSRQDMQATQNLEDVLADDTIHAVILASPHSHHYEQILACAAANKHVYVEKPLTLKREHAVEAVEALKTKNLTLGVGFTRRFQPAFKALVETVRNGDLGEVLHIETEQSGPSGFKLVEGSWRADPTECPAGGMSARGVHVLDSMIHIAGPASEITAFSDRRVLTGQIDDTTAMMLRFKSGISGYLAAIFATADIWRVQVYGSKGSAEMRGEQSLVRTEINGTETVTNFPAANFVGDTLEAFAEAAMGGAEFPVTGDEAINNVAAFEACIQSAETKQWVPIQ